MDHYSEIYQSHDGKLSQKWNHYCPIYDIILSEICREGKPINLLEIGVQNGGSLEIWEKYLPANSQIYGIDIDKKCSSLVFDKNIHFYLGSATDEAFMEEAFSDIKFNVILDDGSHFCKDVIRTFINMFPKLLAGGVYIIEDLQTSYWSEYGGGWGKKDTSIEFLKNIIDNINEDYIVGGRGFMQKIAPKFYFLERLLTKNQITFLRKLLFKKQSAREADNRVRNYYNESVSSISFYDNICAVKKFYKPKVQDFQTVLTGEKDSVVDARGIDGVKIKKNDTLLHNTDVMYFGG